MQAQEEASKPCWYYRIGVQRDKLLQPFQDHLQADLPELFLRHAEEEGNHHGK